METNNQNNKLTEKEIKFLKRTLLSQIFPSLTVTLFLFLILLVYSSINNKFGFVFISLTVISVIIGTIVFFIITRKIRLDLKTGEVIQEKEIIEDKIYKLDYEPGSATFPVNFLSILFINKISQLEMKEVHIYYIKIKGERIDLDKNDFEKVEKGQPIIIRRTPNSNLFLSVETL